MAKTLKMTDKDFKADVLTMLKYIKEHMFIMHKKRKSQKINGKYTI